MFCHFVVASNVCLLILTIVIFCVLVIMFFCMWCDTLLDMEYDVLLVFIGALYLRVYIPWIAVCWSYVSIVAEQYSQCGSSTA